MKTTKETAYDLHKAGFSYSKIARELNISKSTAHNYVLELKLQDGDKRAISSKPSSDRSLDVRPERTALTDNVKDLTEEIHKTAPVVRALTGDELLEKVFEGYELEGKFLELIGVPSRPFSGVIWGLPKGGKSNLAIRLADYLNEYFGTVCYVAAEEGISATLKGKISDIGGSSMMIFPSRDKDVIRTHIKSGGYDFVFIDSINNAGIDEDMLEDLKAENPKTSFIAIAQATKSGQFKGDQSLTHNCDVIITVVNGVASQHGRFNGGSQINIFDGPLYEKNPNKVKPKAEEPHEIEGEEIITLKEQPKADINPVITPLDIAPAKGRDNKDVWRDAMKLFPNSPGIQNFAAKQLGLQHTEPKAVKAFTMPPLTKKEVGWGLTIFLAALAIDRLGKKNK